MASCLRTSADAAAVAAIVINHREWEGIQEPKTKRVCASGYYLLGSAILSMVCPKSHPISCLSISKLKKSSCLLMFFCYFLCCTVHACWQAFINAIIYSYFQSKMCPIKTFFPPWVDIQDACTCNTHTGLYIRRPDVVQTIRPSWSPHTPKTTDVVCHRWLGRGVWA